MHTTATLTGICRLSEYWISEGSPFRRSQSSPMTTLEDETTYGLVHIQAITLEGHHINAF